MPLPNLLRYNKVNSEQEMDEFIDLITGWLDDTLQVQSQLTRLCCTTIPEISIKDYLKRHVTWLELSEQHLIYMLVYLKRYLAAAPDDCLSLYNIHRLLTTAISLGHKYFEFDTYETEYFAKVGGIKSAEGFKKLEQFLLGAIKVSLNIQLGEYLDVKEFFAKRALKAGQANSFLTLNKEEQECLTAYKNSCAKSETKRSVFSSEIPKDGEIKEQLSETPHCCLSTQRTPLIAPQSLFYHPDAAEPPFLTEAPPRPRSANS